jgi:hypothetical protein
MILITYWKISRHGVPVETSSASSGCKRNYASLQENKITLPQEKIFYKK